MPKVVAHSSNSSNASSTAATIVPLAALAVGALCLWKLRSTCSVQVHPKCVTVVYDTRRRTILRTSADREMQREDLPRVEHFSPLLYLSRALISQSSPTSLFVPPSSFFASFTLPRGVFEEPGESVACVVEGVQVSDGAVDMYLTVRYMIPFGQLERYLSAVGPQPPNEHIALAAADVVRSHGSELSVGILLSRSRREAVFLEVYREHLATKLMSESAVELLDVVVENVELIEGA